MRVLVVPSNRPEHFTAFLKAWEGCGGWDEIWLIEDAPERTFLPNVARHFSWREIEKTLGADKWVFSRRDSAIRCFGLLAAWWAGAEYALTLDDDCYPGYPSYSATHDFLGRHVLALAACPRWCSTVPRLHVRGLPYTSLGTLENVVVSIGLWGGVPDLDAQTQLAHPELSRNFLPPPTSWVVPSGQYVPVSGMNLCIAHKALPLFYFPLMGEGSPYSRFDDIWAGILAKKAADHLGWHFRVGEPFVDHRRASNPRVNLVKEAPGLELNERFWEVVDGIPLTAGDVLGVVWEMGEALQKAGRRQVLPYIGQLGAALQVWHRLLCQRPEGL